MPRRSTSLSNSAGSAIAREVESKYDVIKEVKDNLDIIEIVSNADIELLIKELENVQDFTGITVVSGAVANWDAITKTLTVPTIKGDKGEIGLTGEQGIKGETGIGVHHIRPTNTTDPEGSFHVPGEEDMFTMYGDADETINLGSFTVANGESAYSSAIGGGFVGTEDEFFGLLGSIGSIATSVEASATTIAATVASLEYITNQVDENATLVENALVDIKLTLCQQRKTRLKQL